MFIFLREGVDNFASYLSAGENGASSLSLSFSLFLYGNLK